MSKLQVSHEFTGLVDYWSGNGRRWDDDAGCLFAFYGAKTTLRDCVEQWIDDFNGGGDCDSFPEDITDNDLREAILDSFTNRGRADYECGALADCAVEFAKNNDLDICRDCGQHIGEYHNVDCNVLIDTTNEAGNIVVQDDCDEDTCFESPVWIILAEVVKDKNEEEWTLYNSDPTNEHPRGQWGWAHPDGREIGPFNTENEAWDAEPEYN